MRPKKPQLLLLKSLITVTKASVDSKMFRKLYFKIGGREIDVLRNGDLSCAFFVTTILKLFSLIRDAHTTVAETVKDLEKSGWKKTSKPRAGSVIVYGQRRFKSGETHKHVGIYIGNGKVVNNRSEKRSPQSDRWNYRPVESILWHKNIK